jgi:threonine/homoserine/homoserine lactone efflux protein
MMDTTLALAFLAAAVPTFFTPGPNNLMLMASTAKFGAVRTVPHMLGISVGFPLMVFVVGLGLGEVFNAYPWLKTVLKWVAAANFLWLAWTLLGLKIGDKQATERPLTFLQAASFQWVNPKAWAMAVSFVALVVQPGEGRIMTLAVLALGCLLLGPFSSSLWMLGGSGLQALLKRTGTERFLGIILAGLMLVAVVLFLL